MKRAVNVSADLELCQAWGRRLFRMRELAKLSQTEFGATLGYSQQAYSPHEKGERYPNLELANKLRTIYGTSIDWLMNEEGPFTFSGIPPSRVMPASSNGERRATSGDGGRARTHNAAPEK